MVKACRRIEVDRPELADQRADIEAALPHARALISLVCRTNREAIRSPARSVGNKEFQQTYDVTNEVARRIVAALEAQGVRALNPSVGFPMEMDRWPARSGWSGTSRWPLRPAWAGWASIATSFTPASAVSSCSRPSCWTPRSAFTTTRSISTPVAERRPGYRLICPRSPTDVSAPTTRSRCARVTRTGASHDAGPV
jgi:hypothetical protein